jgi:hypothetical protein
MSHALSDATIEILEVCRHYLRFAFGAPVGYPYAAATFPQNNPPPRLFRRIQVAWPPPDRQGESWTTWLTTRNGRFDPDNPPADLSEVRAMEGAVALDRPRPDTIVLDWWFDAPRATQPTAFPGTAQDSAILSVPYWPGPVPEHVDYFVTPRIDFPTALDDEQRGKWIAISFDGFWPPERDSADLIARLGDCDGHRAA